MLRLKKSAFELKAITVLDNPNSLQSAILPIMEMSFAFHDAHVQTRAASSMHDENQSPPNCVVENPELL